MSIPPSPRGCVDRREVRDVAQPAAEHSSRASALTWDRSKRRSTRPWIARRTGWNSVATTSVDAATASELDSVNGERIAWATTTTVRERRAQDRGDQRVADDTGDDPVDVVQPVAQDREPDGERQEAHGHQPECPRGVRRAAVRGSIEVANREATIAVANRNHLSCWRSTSRDRRNRRSRLASASRNARGAIALPIDAATWMSVAKGSGGTNGLSGPWGSPQGPGPPQAERPGGHAEDARDDERPPARARAGVRSERGAAGRRRGSRRPG